MLIVMPRKGVSGAGVTGRATRSCHCMARHHAFRPDWMQVIFTLKLCWRHRWHGLKVDALGVPTGRTFYP
ncbi:hypothetical protein CFR73_12645 [Novacetimonas maltaceti]|nr:hypothetical protein CFR73_12645 [Novacetimonas maltaceti]